MLALLANRGFRHPADGTAFAPGLRVALAILHGKENS